MRTVEQFVKEMISRGKTKAQICNVAAASCLVNRKEEVAAECDHQFRTCQST
jgi:hypothetical protein